MVRLLDPTEEENQLFRKSWAVSLTIIFTLFVQVVDCKVLQERPFPSYKNPHFQNECKTFQSCDNELPLHESKKTHFHINGFTLSLALKQWVGETLDYE